MIGSGLNVWPVVQRELREGARRPVNHRLRLLSGGVTSFLLWILLSHSNGSDAQIGSRLFAGLHSMLLGLIFLVVPALTADCIAREKREGTLGLLFLTPLSARGIVVGKALAQGLRAFSLWLAVIPILTIPFLTGGVTWFDALSAFSLEFCAGVLSLGAGLLASCMVKGRNMAFVVAFIIGALSWLVFIQVNQFIVVVGLEGIGALGDMAWFSFSSDTIEMFTGLHDQGGWSSLSTVSPILVEIWGILCAIEPGMALLFFGVIAWFAANRIERSWQDKVPTPRRESLLKRYCTPVFRGRFRRQMQRKLDWNPIAWLQQYSWKARLSKWGLCLLFLIIVSAVMMVWNAGNTGREELEATANLLLAILAGVYTFVAISGFLEEKRSGALELLLVTPISVNKLIFGRVWGLWKQFLPAALILASFDVATNWFIFRSDGDWYTSAQTELIISCGFLALPVFATYFALRVKNLFVAAMLTWVALFIPGLLEPQLYFPAYEIGFGGLLPVFLFIYIIFGMLTCFLLRHSLSRRIYSF